MRFWVLGLLVPLSVQAAVVLPPGCAEQLAAQGMSPAEYELKLKPLLAILTPVSVQRTEAAPLRRLIATGLGRPHITDTMLSVLLAIAATIDPSRALLVTSLRERLQLPETAAPEASETIPTWVFAKVGECVEGRRTTSDPALLAIYERWFDVLERYYAVAIDRTTGAMAPTPPVPGRALPRSVDPVTAFQLLTVALEVEAVPASDLFLYPIHAAKLRSLERRHGVYVDRRTGNLLAGTAPTVPRPEGVSDEAADMVEFARAILARPHEGLNVTEKMRVELVIPAVERQFGVTVAADGSMTPAARAPELRIPPHLALHQAVEILLCVRQLHDDRFLGKDFLRTGIATYERMFRVRVNADTGTIEEAS